jgi:hypothetical protein
LPLRASLLEPQRAQRSVAGPAEATHTVTGHVFTEDTKATIGIDQYGKRTNRSYRARIKLLAQQVTILPTRPQMLLLLEWLPRGTRNGHHVIYSWQSAIQE